MFPLWLGSQNFRNSPQFDSVASSDFILLLTSMNLYFCHDYSRLLAIYITGLNTFVDISFYGITLD